MYITGSFVCVWPGVRWPLSETKNPSGAINPGQIRVAGAHMPLRLRSHSQVDGWDGHGTCYTFPSIPRNNKRGRASHYTRLDPCSSTSVECENVVCVAIPFNRVSVALATHRHGYMTNSWPKDLAIVSVCTAVDVRWTWQRRGLFALFSPRRLRSLHLLLLHWNRDGMRSQHNTHIRHNKMCRKSLFSQQNECWAGGKGEGERARAIVSAGIDNIFPKSIVFQYLWLCSESNRFLSFHLSWCRAQPLCMAQYSRAWAWARITVCIWLF